MCLQENIKICTELINEEEILNLAAAMIKQPSCAPDFQEGKIAAMIADKLNTYQIPYEIFPLQNLPSGGKNRANLLFSIGNQNKPHLLLCGHFDTVPPLEVSEWNHPPFDAHLEDGILYGRGTTDMKCGVAAMVMAMCYIHAAGIPLPGRISFLGTAGEEVGLDGMKAFIQQHGIEPYDAVLVGEASDRTLYTAQRGALWLEFKTNGVAVHAGISNLGVNAAENMLKLLAELKKCTFVSRTHPLFGDTLVNINYFRAGEAINIVPDQCICGVDIRTVPGADHNAILLEIDTLLKHFLEKENIQVSYRIIANQAPTETDQNHALIKAARQASTELFSKPLPYGGCFYGTDSSIMRRQDGCQIPYLIYGPGNPLLNHKLNEHIQVKALSEAVKMYISTALHYLTKPT